MEAVERAIRELPLLTRVQVMEEAAYDPRFWSYFMPLVLSPTPGKAIDEAMTKALINEMNPTRFPESSGQWPMLRAFFRRIIEIARSEGTSASMLRMGDLSVLGQSTWDAIASVIGSVGKTTTQLYQAYLNQRLEKVRVEAEKAARQRELEAIKRQAEAQRVRVAPVPTVKAAPTVGFPTWIMYALGVLALVVSGYAVYRKTRG